MSHHPRLGRKEQATCLVCHEAKSKYSCSTCLLPYCSVACYKKHKEVSSSNATSDLSSSSGNVAHQTDIQYNVDSSVLDATPLKPLTSLKWPYISNEEANYPDPLERNDPKPLRMRHYEAIATSPEVRKTLFLPSTVPGQPDQPNVALRTLLTSIDKLSGVERERAIQHALDADNGKIFEFPQDGVRALRALAEAIEGAARGENGMSGLDWE
ncbi:hypothetical protein J3R30DRAFT_3298915 [Lentinula aciculospora]|uniref:HIT-type domain-containing protein n=1 Tax=Lentinula aciculospora TaxID=153920 RepID=A0A9W9A1P3_9AGAR|nr:hypothetical protein J3R30DRAFT_3298915 [Lentinula aciculospora]